MFKTLLSPDPLSFYETGLVVIRIFVGLMMAYHGWEVFTPSLIAEYTKWDVIKVLPSPLVAVYIGKGLELITGILLALGLLTRFAAIFMAIDMLFITFYIGGGRFYYEAQHPFLFALIAIIFFLTGPVKWDLDSRFFK